MFTVIWEVGSNLINKLNENLEGYSPAFIIAGTLAAIAVMQNATRLRHEYLRMRYGNGSTRDIKKSLINTGYAIAKALPFVASKVKDLKDREVKKFLSPLHTKVLDKIKATEFTSPFMPKKSMPTAEVLKLIGSDLQAENRKGRLSGGMYADHDEETINLLGEVYKLTAFTNPMHSTWPKINAMEAQMMSWFHHLFNNHRCLSADELPRIPPGFITDGGTMSNFEVCRAFVRDAKKRGIVNPVIIAPETAHISFDNAASALGARLLKVPINKKTGAADVKAMEKCVTKNTCMLVGSAPSFPCGIFDPIEELAEVALKHHLPLHVDACLGAFFNIFSEKAGYPVPRFDFSIRGVSTISADPHKYGLSAKGCSVVLFSPDCPTTSVFGDFDWKGGIYVTPGLKGSRRGDAIAGLYALLVRIGEEGYVQITKDIMELTFDLTQQVRKIPGIVLRYEPQFPLITFDTEEGINCHLVASQLANAHWEINMINPTGFHFCLTQVHAKTPNFIDDFVTDLKAATEFARKNPTAKPKDMAKVYGAMSKMIFPDEVLQEVAERYVAIKTSLPDFYMTPVVESKEERRRPGLKLS